jgi:hypothetical protein
MHQIARPMHYKKYNKKIRVIPVKIKQRSEYGNPNGSAVWARN